MADLTVTAGSVLFTSGTKNQGIAGAAITAGQGVYLDAATTTIKLAIATSAAAADAVGIALHAAGTGQPITYAGNGSVINIGATTAKTTAYMVSGGAAGGVAPQADLISTNKIVYLGYATATDGSFVVNIRNTGAAV
jgi:hypothetical protein